jgi:hypothetical protein
MNKTHAGFNVFGSIFVALLLVASAWGQNAQVLVTFGGSRGEGEFGLVADAAGNLYGAGLGGPHDAGTVFKLSQNSDGSWTQTLLHAFGGAADGSYPNGGLIIDHAGNLFGSTCLGGPSGAGIVYELSPQANGQYTESLIFALGYGQYCYPYGNTLAMDTAGNLYGISGFGGYLREGQVFKLSPQGSGMWRETILHNFGHNPSGEPDGINPMGGVTVDSAGNVYGTAYAGGTFGMGIVYKLAPVDGGLWKEIIIHNFEGPDGKYPVAGVILDAAGNIYGIAQQGGKGNSGAVYQLTQGENGGWVRNVIHSFVNNGTDGAVPTDGLTIDAAGNLYGTTHGGGAYGDGLAFELSANGDGTFSFNILQTFGDDLAGTHPYAGLTLDSAGNLYGTTTAGSAQGVGSAYKITP